MLNFRELEEKMLERWEREKTFKKSLELRKNGEKFIFYEGPPTANGRPGIHHVLVRVYKDIICRYKTMCGYLVERKAGWDTHGLPVELEVEKELDLKSKKDIEAYGIAEFNKKCKESVWKYKDEWEKLTKRIGFWLEMTHPYVTYEWKYMESLWWIIKEFWNRKLLSQGHKVVPYCARCGTGLSSHEVAQGYESVTENSLYVRFRVRAQSPEWENTSILAWTTTPWTLPGNVALAVHPERAYVCIPDPWEEGRWLALGMQNFLRLVEKGLLPASFRDLKEPDIDTFPGKDLVGISYEPLFHVPELVSNVSHKVYGAEFVSSAEGTGVVHVAPMYGEDDYNLGEAHGLPKFHTVELDGTLRRDFGIPGEGKFAKAADADITEDLRARGLLYAVENYTHDYPFCWRCESPLLYYAKPSWFVKMSALRDELKRNNDGVNWVPEHLKRGRFGEWIAEAKDWAFSRERYWGTPLPVWECEKCKTQRCVGSLDELSELAYGKRGNTYWLMRHGQATANLTQTISMTVDDPSHLTEEGRRSVEAVAGALKKIGIDHIVSSDLIRTKETAEVIGGATGAEVVFDPRLRELNHGDFHGKKVPDYIAYYDTRGLNRVDHAVEGGEKIPDLRQRVMAVLRDLETRHRGKRILIVSHGDPLWVLERTLVGYDDDDFRKADALPKPEYPRFADPRETPYRTLPYDEDGRVNLHRPYIDGFYLRCACGGKMTRVKDLVDVWFDSGAMPWAQTHFPFAQTQNAKRKTQNLGIDFPADYICEAVDQTRGWFYTLLAVSTALGHEAPYRNVISLAHVLDKNGQKMSKSRGNVVDPWQVIEKYGTDAVRWYFFTVNDAGDYKLFNEEHIAERLRGFLNAFWNCMVFYKTYRKQARNEKQRGESKHDADRRVLATLELLVGEVRVRLDTYDVTGAARAIETFVVDDLSQWYVQTSRERLQERAEAMAVLRRVLETVLRLTAPFIPFIADAAWQELDNDGSVHLADYPPHGLIIEEEKVNLIRQDQVVRNEVSKGLAMRAEAKIGVRQPLARYTIPTNAGSVFDIEVQNLSKDFLDILKARLNVKEVVFGAEAALDTTITEELKLEGEARELIRQIQDARKRAGLKPGEEIALTVGSAEAKGLLEHTVHGAAIRAKTSVRKWKFEENGAPLTITRV